MAAVATDTANNTSSHRWPLPATAIVTFIVAKGPVHHSEVPELLTLPVVRVLRRGGDRLDDGLNERLGLVDLFLGICRDEAVKRLLVIVGFDVRAASAFLDGALPSDYLLAPDLVFMSVRLHPRGPRSWPMKFASGKSLAGMYSFSLILPRLLT